MAGKPRYRIPWRHLRFPHYVSNMVHFGQFSSAKPVYFYRADSGREPVREWLRKLPRDDRKRIGQDIATLQLGWPVGMPLARKLEPEIWEIRSRLNNSIARILFTVRKDSIVLLHAFVKKTQKTPARELRLARRRLETL